MVRRSRAWRALPAALFVFLIVARTWGVTDRFLMLGDQIRDWGIALGPFTSLPWVGPVTHVGGYTLGPAFYWILWAIRVTVGPWFDNLPHAGGIGSAVLQSAADVLLLVAIRKKTGSTPLALAAALLLATAAYDLSLSATVWNPVIASVLAKTATALVLLGWADGSLGRAAATMVVAWAGFQSHMPALYAAIGVATAVVAPPLAARRWRDAGRRAMVVTAVVVVMQLPYAAHRVWRDPGGGGAVSVVESLARVASGDAPVRFGWSAGLFATAFDVIQVRPWHAPWLAWLVVAGAAVVLVRHRRDPALAGITVVPLAVAFAGYALWLGASDSYYFLSLMPAAVLVLLLGATAYGPPRARQSVAAALLVVALLLIPARLREAEGLHRLPEYVTIVRASRRMAGRDVPLRRIEMDFLPPTCDPEFVYRILGGRIEAEWIASVTPRGEVSYRRASGPPIP